MAAEAYSEMGGSPREEEREELSDTELDDRGTQCRKKSVTINQGLFLPFLLLCFILILALTCWSMFPPLVPSPDPSPARNHQLRESQEEFDLLFDSVVEEQVPSPKEEGPPPLSDNDLAVFDPCYKQGENKCE